MERSPVVVTRVPCRVADLEQALERALVAGIPPQNDAISASTHHQEQERLNDEAFNPPHPPPSLLQQQQQQSSPQGSTKNYPLARPPADISATDVAAFASSSSNNSAGRSVAAARNRSTTTSPTGTKMEQQLPQQQRPPVVYFPVLDAVWLGCRKSPMQIVAAAATIPATCSSRSSSTCPLEAASIAGLAEPSAGIPNGTTNSPHMVDFCVCQYIAPPPITTNSSTTTGTTTMNTTSFAEQCIVETCKNDWTRCHKDLSYEPPSAGIDINQELSVVVVVQWFDLRSVAMTKTTTKMFSSNNNNNHESSSAFVYSFLQSVLGSDHTASPWVQQPQHRDHPVVDCVMLLLENEAPGCLRSFRVSDACPSWGLYSSAFLDLSSLVSCQCQEESDKTGPSNDSVRHGTCLGCLTNNSTTRNGQQQQHKGQQTQSVGELLIYRRLPPRLALASRHFLTDQPVLVPGCLWEAVLQEGEPIEETTIDDLPLPSSLPTVMVRLTGPPYIDFGAEYASTNCNLQALLEPAAQAILQAEVATLLPHWTAWPEQQHYRTKHDSAENTTSSTAAPWNVFPLCYCFPAYDISRRQWIAATTALVPQTVALLRKYGGDDYIRTALFSRLDANAVLEAHTGWADLANHVYRIHIPIVIPDDAICGTWVDGCVMTHASDQIVAFDDSKIHRAFHYSSSYSSNKSRIVLIVDVARPSHMPMGTASGGHSEELDLFIAQFALPH